MLEELGATLSVPPFHTKIREKLYEVFSRIENCLHEITTNGFRRGDVRACATLSRWLDAQFIHNGTLTLNARPTSEYADIASAAWPFAPMLRKVWMYLTVFFAKRGRDQGADVVERECRTDIG